MAFSELAGAYHGCGANVVPVSLRDGPRRVVPLIEWRDLTTRRQTADEVADLKARFTGAGVAIVLRGLVDLETDGRKGEDALRRLRFPLTLTASWRSPRGVHRLYRTRRPLPTRIRLRPQFDVLGAGHLVVLPTSPGREWCVPGGLEVVADLPSSWESFLTEGTEGRLTGDARRERELNGAPQGQRNIVLASLVGAWLTAGVSQDEILRKAQAWRLRCDCADFTPAEVARVVGSILSTRQRTRTPERAAWLRGIERGLRQPELGVYVGLVVHQHELGLAGQPFYAPHRTLARVAGVSKDTIGAALKELQCVGLVRVSVVSGPVGKPETRIDLL